MVDIYKTFKNEKLENLKGNLITIIGGSVLLGLCCVLGGKMSIDIPANKDECYDRREQDQNYYRRATSHVYDAPLFGYSSAVRAISNCDMSSYYKESSIKKIRKDCDSEYYRAIIAIAEAEDMSSYYKWCAIEDISLERKR